MNDSSNDSAIKKGGSSWTDLFLKEDYWAIWLGFTLIFFGLIFFLPNPPNDLDKKLIQVNGAMAAESQKAPFKTLSWYEAYDSKNKLKAKNEPFAKQIRAWLVKPKGWSTNPLQAFVMTGSVASKKAVVAGAAYIPVEEKTAQLKQTAELAESKAATQTFNDEFLNAEAKKTINEYRMQKRKDSSAKSKTNVKNYNQLGYLLVLGLVLACFFAIGIQFINGKAFAFLKGFAFIYILAILAYFIAAQSDIKAIGIGYAAWAILLGLLISNTIGTPKWAMPAVQVEYYIKTGLVLLGAEILFGKIMTIGIPGIFVAWVVTPIVLVSSYWFGQKVLKIESKTLNITLSADMSVCGVSAAIATAAACQAKKEELTLAVGISLVFTSIMMVVVPNIINAIGMDHVLGGAWIGGTLDATGAVAAAGAFLSDKALYVATTVKLIQNIMIGVIAFAVAVYWVTYVEKRDDGQKPSLMEIWYRFPKFVIGFIVASITISIIYESLGDDQGRVMINDGVIGGWTSFFRGWFFCLAFVSIGLSTDFRKLAGYLKGGKPVILYLCGQGLNLVLTLIMAYLMFYVVFPEITASI